MTKSNTESEHYCACGCRTQIKPHCTWAPGHNRRHQGPEYEVNENGCWIWQKTRTPNDETAAITGESQYGVAWTGETVVPAYRLYYERHKGSIPGDYQIDHKCPNGPNTLCVNPDHLEAVTRRTNVRRSRVTRLSAQDVREIRYLRGVGKTYAEIAAEYGVSGTRIYQLTAGRDALTQFEDE